jgi:hypothetical protein
MEGRIAKIEGQKHVSMCYHVFNLMVFCYIILCIMQVKCDSHPDGPSIHTLYYHTNTQQKAQGCQQAVAQILQWSHADA